MSFLFPSQNVLHQSFYSPLSPRTRANPAVTKATPYQARPELYMAYSVVDDAKNKAQKLSAEAQQEFNKASQTAPKQLELYTPTFYAAATFGGLLACVSDWILHTSNHELSLIQCDRV